MRLRHGEHIVPLETTDAASTHELVNWSAARDAHRSVPRYEDNAVGEVLKGIEQRLGLLDPGDLTNIKMTLSKYSGLSARVTQMGMARAADASRHIAAQREEIQSVQRQADAFWEKQHDALLRAAGQR